MMAQLNTNPIRLPAPGMSRSTAAGSGARPNGHYDAASSNSSGRVEADACGGTKAKLLDVRNM